MFDIFMFSFNAVMPILLLMLLGFFLKCIHFADEAFFKKLNTMVFKLFLPVLLFVNIYEIDSLKTINLPAIIYCLAAILLICAVGLTVSKLVTQKRERISVITQCSFRSNYAIVGIPLALSLGGNEAAAFASILSAVSIPLFNVLAVIVLSHYSGSEKSHSIKETFLKTIKNPLIIGVFCGIIVVFIRSLLPVGSDGTPIFTLQNNLPFIYKSIKTLSLAASPVALVVLGARFDFSAVGELKKEIVTATVLRVAVAPLIGIGCAILLSEYTSVFEFTNIEYPALISLFSTPTAVSSAVMVGEIGGDEQLAGQLVVWTSVISMFTIYAIVFIMKSFAFI